MHCRFFRTNGRGEDAVKRRRDHFTKLYNFLPLPCKKSLWRKRFVYEMVQGKFLLPPSLIPLQSPPHIRKFSARPPMPASLSNNIRRLRFDRGMTQEELALRVGVSRQTIMSIERGATNPSVLLAYKVSMALQAPISEVFQMEGGLMPV